MKEALTFNDVNIVPMFSDIDSRSQVELFTAIAPSCVFDLPVISANMDTVTGPQMAKAMLNSQAQACLHRFGSIEDTVKMFKESSFGSGDYPMVSIGLGNKELERAEALIAAGALNFVIDVAHGAQFGVLIQAAELRHLLGDYGSITVGNFASAKSVRDYLEGQTKRVIDAIKVGVGPGAACSTRIKTGVGVPQFTAIQEIAAELKNTNIKIIGDGGLKTPGDIAKALGAGAHAVMVGSMLAGTQETPGEVIYPEGPGPQCPVKIYRGSASFESYVAQGKTGTHRTTEGESYTVPYKGPVADVLQDIEGGLRSAFTYVGARNLKEFHEKVEFVRVTHAGHVEGTPHGKK